MSLEGDFNEQSIREIIEASPRQGEDEHVAELAHDLSKFYNSGFRDITHIRIVTNEKGEKPKFWLGYEDSERISTSGPEDTMSDQIEVPIELLRESKDLTDADMFKRGLLLAGALHATVLIDVDERMGSIFNGNLHFDPS